MMEVRVDGWKKAIRFSSAHATLNLGKCERLHGHTYVIHANVQGEVEDRRVVFDFVELTRALRQIAEELDHYVLVPTKGAPLIQVQVKGEEVHMNAQGTKYVLPKRDCYLLPTATSTAEDLVGHILGEVRTRVKWPGNVTRVEIGVDEGYGQGAWSAWEPGKTGAKR
jgi:6-pyruvoyltetrahydropterin/6-carboxytetrahydropterin synthase